MFKKIGIILFFAAAVGARHAVPLQGLSLLFDTAFAAVQENGQPCPPECVTDSMEIVTWYPSPYNEYEELRLYPISESNSPNGQCGQDNRGLMYYDKEEDKVYICKGAILGWKELGSGGSLTQSDTSISFCDSTNLGTIVYDTAQKRPYVCAQNTSNVYVWKPLDSDYDRDGITDKIDTNDYNFNDATATEADVLQGKTFYAGGQARTGTMPDPHACDTLGGVWVSSQNTCYFSGTSCKTGWSPNQSYSTTQYSYCKVYASCEAATDSCTTGSHNRANAGIESCGYKYLSGDFCLNATCYATQTEIGCKKN